MWKYAASLLQKFAGITPLKEFFKYIFRRISNDFLDKEPNIDFKSGVLELEDLPLSTLKINSTFLASSPYVLHQGILKKLRITLPNISELTSKSIEVYVSGLYITLKPNKEFELRFNQKLKQIKQNSKFYDDDDIVRQNVNVDTSMDFFREVIKQILTNIKINVENVCIRVFMNRPSQKDSPQKPQYFLMLRMPLCQIEKVNDLDSSKITDPSEKFKLQIPQISLHILREDMKLTEYSNLHTKKGDFPFTYPSVKHPSTLLLIGTQDKVSLPNFQNTNGSQILADRKTLIIILKITKNAKFQKLERSLKIDVSNLEIMLQGSQLQVLLRFTRQLQEFKMLYNRSLQSLKLQDKDLYKKVSLDVSQDIDIKGFDPTLQKKTSSYSQHTINLNASLDVFASMVFNAEENVDLTLKRSTMKKQNAQPGYIDTILQLQNDEAKGLKNKVKQFQEHISAEDKKKLIEAGNIQYQAESDVRLRLGVLCVYILKYNNFKLVQYERAWITYVNGKPSKINQSLPCSYFMLRLKTLTFESQQQQIVFNIKNLQLLDVNICRKPQAVIAENFQSSMEFKQPIKQSQNFNDIRLSQNINESDMFKSFKSFTAKEQEFDVDSPTHGPSSRTLEKFIKKPNDHYCCNTILAISNHSAQPKPHKSTEYKKYNMLAEKSNVNKQVYDWAISIKSSESEKTQTKVDILIKSITCVMDLVVMRDILNILNPIFMYRGIVDNISLKRQQISNLNQATAPSIFSNKALYYSRYDMSDELMEKQPKSEPKNKKTNQPTLIYNVCLDQFKLAVRSLNIGTGLIDKERNKFEDKESFQYQNCFCKYRGDAIAIILQNAQLKSTSRKKISFCRLQLNLFNIDTANCSKELHKYMYEPLLYLNQNAADKSISRIYFEQFTKRTILNISLPKIYIPILQAPTKRVLDAIGCLMSSFSELSHYSRYLRQEMRRLECLDLMSASSMNRKNQKIRSEEEQIDIVLHLGVLQIQVLDAVVYVKDIVASIKEKAKMVMFNDLLVINQNVLKVVLRNTSKSAQNLSSFDGQIIDMKKFDIQKPEFAEKVILHIKNTQQLQIQKLTSQSEDRSHFSSLQKLKMSFKIKISAKPNLQDSKINLNRLKGAPIRGNKHNLNRLETIVQQQGQGAQTQLIQFTTINPIVIRACQLVKILEPIQKFSDFIVNSVAKFTKIQAPPQIGSRKNSQEVTNNKRDINLKVAAVDIDLFPVFQKRPDRQLQIMSNTRSFVTIQDAQLNISITSQGDIEGNVEPKFILNGRLHSIGYSLLYFLDNIPDNNIILLSAQDLQNYGFRQFLSINHIDLDLRTKPINQKLIKVEVAATIQEINYESTAKGISYLMHHIKHLTNSLTSPSAPQSHKKERKQSVIELIDEDDQSAEDLEQIQKQLLKIQKKQKEEEQEFRLCRLQIIPKTGPNSRYELSLHVKMIQIKKLIINIFKGNEFDFLPYVGEAIEKPAIFFLNDDNTIEKCYDIDLPKENNEDTKNKKRVLKTYIDKSTNLRVIAEDICFEVHNYVNKQQSIIIGKEPLPEHQQLNFIARFQMKCITCLVNKVSEDIFYLIKSSSRIILLTEIESNKVKISCSQPRLMLGFTSNLNFISDEMKQIDAQIQKIYHKIKQEEAHALNDDNPKSIELYLLIPECTITLNLQLKGLQFISNQVMRIPELYFHSRICNYMEEENKKFMKSWITEVVTKNLGSLLGNGAVALVSKSIWLLMALFKQVVFLPKSLISMIQRRRA